LNLRIETSTILTGAVGLMLVLVLTIMAIFAPLIAPHDPTAGALDKRLKPPFWQEKGSKNNLLGTDLLGRDILSRIIYGARTSLTISIITILLSGMIGSFLGIVSGYLGGWVDALIMRAVDVAFSFPAILLALLLAVVFGPSFLNIILIISFVLWAQYARMSRGETLRLKEMDYVALAQIAGCSKLNIIMRHLFPNAANPLIILATLQVGVVIILESSLSFLGVGIPPPTPAWGAMVAEGRSYVVSAWWVSLIPGVAILLTVLSFNLLGDALTEYFDPSQRI
jgi:peptide/nickel transport system permease protein